MRKLPVRSGVLLVAAMAFAAACGGGTAATNAPVVSLAPVNVPSVSIPSIPPIVLPSVNIPSIPPIVLPSGLSSFSIPSFSIPSFSIPSFNSSADPELAAKFPTTIGGSPVTNVQTFRLMDLFTAFGESEQSQQFVQAMAASGIDANSVVTGTADATVNSSSVKLTAFRVPGVSASQFLSALPQIAQTLDPTHQQPTVGQQNIGGKTVTTFTDPNENVTYYYPSGDVIWSTDSSDPAAVATIMSALP
jgi:hypothetical protein